MNKYPDIYKKVKRSWGSNFINGTRFLFGAKEYELSNKSDLCLKKKTLITALMTYTFFIIFIISFFLMPNHQMMQENRLPVMLIELIKNRKFEEAARMFSQPPYIDEMKDKEEIESIKKWFELVSEHIGNIYSYSESAKSVDNVLLLFISGGNIEYWNNFKGDVKKKIFTVNFSKIGKSYVFIEICKRDYHWEIKSLTIAIPKEKSNEDIIKDIIEGDLGSGRELG